ncbi:MAG: Ig-like domain-containing protein [Bacteroidaceae bacterium]|nr:Ig-like domain-containing protein [Bacteroidaceae bacterium]
MNCKITRLLSLFMVMFAMSLPTLASNHYSKVVATAVGEGKVYASKSQTDSPAYTDGSSEATTENGRAYDAPTNTYYLYAQANEGNVFVGWYEDAECSGAAASTEANYTVSITAESTDKNSPTTKTFYAKFVSASAPIFGYSETRVYANISEGTYKNETLTASNISDAITYASSNENVATVAADGTVTLIKNGSCYITAKAGELEASYTLTVIDDVAAGVTQIGNGDFEDWRGVTSSNHAPDNWNSFETAEGSLASLSSAQQVQMVEGGRPGSDGLYCVDIWSRSVVGVVAQGNLTTGCINAGAISASDKNNYNYSNILDPKKSEMISKIPTAIKLWVKFVPAAVNEAHPNAHIAVTVHDAHNYITYSSGNDNEENQSYAIANALYDFPACDWTEVTIPFERTGNYTDGQMYILVNLATNADPGQGQAGDHLYIDDIELVYEAAEPVVYDKYVSVGHDVPVAAPIEVTFNDDNTIDFSLKNFGLDLGGTYANVGNVTVPGLGINNQGSFAFEGDIQITAGDKEGVEMWLGPTLGDIPVVLNGTIKGEYFYVHLDINIPGAPVEVEVGDLAEATFKVGDALIGTFCAPFTVAIPAEYQSYATISTVTDAGEDGVLTLESIETGIIPAHTPVVVQIPMAFEMPASGIYVKGTPTAGLLTGVYEDTPAPVGSYVLQNNADVVGFYQVAQGQQPTVKANRCYLTVPNTNVKVFYFNAEDAEEATGINAIENGELTIDNAAIYNMAGQKVNKTLKGIYIINGKKVLK